MKILYISRQFNRSGYYIFENLIQTRKKDILALVVPPYWSLLDFPIINRLTRLSYFLETKWYKTKPCRFFESMVRLARQNKIPVYHLQTVKDLYFFNLLNNLNPDIIIIGGGWPELIPEKVINYPRLGIINAHPSLLPNFRGTNVHRWQIMNGVKKSGTTIHFIDSTFDTGPIIAQKSVDITETDIPQNLSEKTARTASQLIKEVLAQFDFSHTKPPAKEQQERKNKTLYYPKWDWSNKNIFHIKWEQNAIDIYNLIRASNQISYKYNNGPYFKTKKGKFFIRKAVVCAEKKGLPGQIIAQENNHVIVGCGEKNQSLSIIQIQKYNNRAFNWYKGEPGQHLLSRYGLKIGDYLL